MFQQSVAQHHTYTTIIILSFTSKGKFITANRLTAMFFGTVDGMNLENSEETHTITDRTGAGAPEMHFSQIHLSNPHLPKDFPSAIVLDTDISL